MDKNNILAIWSFKKDLPLKKITKKEKLFTQRMSDDIAYQYIHSRGYARYALSQIFNENALEIPLNAQPHSAPELPSNYGHISFSHCKDILVIGWSMKRIGIDIERADRQISNINYFKKLFADDFKTTNLKSSEKEVSISRCIDFWVLKEALVKWEKSSILCGLKNWKLSEDCIHANNYKSGMKVKIQKIDFNEWKIGLASNHFRNFHPIQICA